MMPRKKKRPWWRRKTEVGACLTILGQIMYLIPATVPAAPIVTGIGALLTGTGVAHRNIKKEAT